LIFTALSARSIVCLQVNQEYLYADLLRCQKGLFTDIAASNTETDDVTN